MIAIDIFISVIKFREDANEGRIILYPGTKILLVGWTQFMNMLVLRLTKMKLSTISFSVLKVSLIKWAHVNEDLRKNK